MRIELYSDGSATTSDKPGGYGWVMVINGAKHSEGNGYMDFASNNDAELEGAIQGLAAVYQFLMNAPTLSTYSVTLVSDSEIILNWANGTYAFRQENKIQKYNLLRQHMTSMRVNTRWVQGHTGDEHNERCDRLANAGRLQVPVDEVKKETKKKVTTQSFTQDYVVYVKEDLKLYVHYKGKIKEIDLEQNTVKEYNE